MGAAAALAVTALAGASVAWACSAQPQAGINGGQTTGPVGAQLTVTGRDFGHGPVQVRWNSKSGQLLGEGQGPSFAVAITIPQAPTGVHYIVAFEPVGTSSASLAFEVIAPARTKNTSTNTNDTSGTTSSSASGAEDQVDADTGSSPSNTSTNSGSSPTQSSNSTPSQSSGTSSGTISSGQSSESSDTASAGASTGEASTSQPSSGTARSTSAAVTAPASDAGSALQPRAASANPAVVTNTAGQAVFGGSSATPVAPGEPDAPSAATVSGDTWSGFGAGAKPSLLDNASTTPAPAGGSGSGLSLGVGLLGAGVVALFAGFAAAESSRKRALAGAERL